MSVELRRLVMEPAIDPQITRIGTVTNRLVDMMNGSAGGRLWLIGEDDGIRREILGGAEIDTDNYRFRATSSGGKLGRFEHSNGTDMVLDITDDGLQIKGTVDITGAVTIVGNTAITGTFGVTGPTTLTGTLLVTGQTQVQGPLLADGAVTLGNAAGDVVSVLGTSTFAEIVTMVKGLIVDTPTFVVDAVNNRVGIGTATPRTGLDLVGGTFISGTYVLPTAGSGLELYTLGSVANIDHYDYTSSAYLQLRIGGKSLDLHVDDVNRISMDGTGIGFNDTPPVAQPAAGSAASGTLASATTLVNTLRDGLIDLGLFS